MTKTKTRPYDSAEYLDTPETIAAYLTAAVESGDASFIVQAIGDAARARGMTDIAKEAGVSRENLYRALSGETRPEFGTILSVLRALGVELRVQPLPAKADQQPASARNRVARAPAPHTIRPKPAAGKKRAARSRGQ
jgi:probable addiction module antidote protein